jgi:hypothetical protein
MKQICYAYTVFTDFNYVRNDIQILPAVESNTALRNPCCLDNGKNACVGSANTTNYDTKIEGNYEVVRVIIMVFICKLLADSSCK